MIQEFVSFFSSRALISAAIALGSAFGAGAAVGQSAYSSLSIAETTHSGLAQQFDRLCGDSFCEGYFSNIRSLELVCAVKNGHWVERCIWNFAGTNVEIDPISGQLQTESHVYSCAINIQGTTSQVQEFLRTASRFGAYAAGLTELVIPSSEESLYLQLSRCALGSGL